MKVGILGSGDVAKSLGEGFIKHDHQVMLGTRSPDKLAEWVRESGGAQTGSFSETAKFGETVILAVKGGAAADVLKSAGAENLKGKVVIDVCNPIEEAAPVDGVLKFFTGPNESLMEQLQKQFPTARFVKAFNSVGADHMVDPKFPGGKPTMFICGNEEQARKAVAKILDQFGWEIADMGKAIAARAIEPLCMLWCIPGFLRNEWSHAFKLLK